MKSQPVFRLFLWQNGWQRVFWLANRNVKHIFIFSVALWCNSLTQVLIVRLIKRTGSQGAIRKSLNTNKQMQMPGDYILSVIYIGQKQIADTSNKSFDNKQRRSSTSSSLAAWNINFIASDVLDVRANVVCWRAAPVCFTTQVWWHAHC